MNHLSTHTHTRYGGNTMRIIERMPNSKTRLIYHDHACGFYKVDLKVECIHCPRDLDEDCAKCHGHGWLWGSTARAGVGFKPYTLHSIYF